MEIIQDGLVNSKTLGDLPDEMLDIILTMVRPKDIISLSQTCKWLNIVIKKNEDLLWTKVCKNYYKIDLPSANGFSTKFYKNVLHKYGHLIGWWIHENHMSSHEGLLHILYEDGQLLGFDLQVPRPSLKRTEPLHPKSLFRIFMDKDNNDEAIVKCCLSPATSQLNLELKYIFKQGPAKDGYGQLLNPPKWYLVTNHITNGMSQPWIAYQHEQYQRFNALEAEHQVDINDEHFDVLFVDDGPFVDDRDMRYPFGFLSPYHYSRLQFPLAPEFLVPINPGIFTAISSWFDAADNQIKSARQLVMLSYAGQDGDKEVTGLFLTGDFHVLPVSKICFRSSLHHCIGVDERNQQQKEGGAPHKVIWKKDITPQPYQIPPMLENVVLEKFPDLPDVCLAKFQGFATIATDCFDDPVPRGLLTEGQWVVYNESVFSFIVTHGQKAQMTLFHRVENSLLQQTRSL